MGRRYHAPAIAALTRRGILRRAIRTIFFARSATSLTPASRIIMCATYGCGWILVKEKLSAVRCVGRSDARQARGICHSHARGNPSFSLDPRLRGDDEPLTTDS